MERKTTKQVGKQGEAAAYRYLTDKGMKLCETNFQTRWGEIDIIGYHKGYLVFVEVKYRSSQKAGVPESAVTIQKQKKICRVADYYRYIHHIGEQIPVRYDVIAVDNREIRWYQNAFFHIFSYK